MCRISSWRRFAMGDDDDLTLSMASEGGGKWSRRSLKLQVATALNQSNLQDADDDGTFEEMVMELQPRVRTIDDLTKALAASYAQYGEKPPNHRTMLIHCLDEERDELVALPGKTPLSAISNVDELIVTMRGSASNAGQACKRHRAANGNSAASAPPPGPGIAQRKADLLRASTGSNAGGGSSCSCSCADGRLPAPATLASLQRNREQQRKPAPALPPPTLPSIPPPPPPPVPPSKQAPPAPIFSSGQHNALMSELASRQASGSSGLVAGGSSGRPPPPPPAKSGSFLDSTEFQSKLERRKQMADATEQEPRQIGGSSTEAIVEDGLSYLDQLAAKIAARQQGK